MAQENIMTQEELQLENEKLNARLAKATEIFKEQKATITSLENDNNQLKEIYSKQVIEIADLKEKIIGLSSDISIYADKITELQDKLNCANTSYTELEADYATITDENVKLKEELDSLRSETAASLSKIDELKARMLKYL